MPKAARQALTPARLRLLGLAGSVLLACAALADGALTIQDQQQRGSLGWLRVTIGIVLGYAGLALLVGAWLGVGRLLRGDGGPDLRWLRTTLVAWAVPVALVPPLFSRDVYAYAAQGDLLAHGMNPYAHGPADLPSRWAGSVSPVWRHAKAPYGPLFMVLARGAAQLSGGRLWLAIGGLRLVAVAGVVVLAVAVPRLAAALGTRPTTAFWLGVLNPLVLGHLVGGAHAEALMAGLMVAGLAVAARGRPAAGAALVALAVMVKAPAVLALPFLAVLWASSPRRDGREPASRALARAVGGTALVAAAVVAAVTAVTGLGFGWVPAMAHSGASQQWTSVSTGLGMAVGYASHLLGGDWTHPAITVTRTAGTALAAAVVAALWVRAARAGGDIRRVVGLLGTAMAVVVVLSPVVQIWYLLWFLVLLAPAAWGERALTAVSAIAALVTLPDGYNLARITGRVGAPFDVAVVAAAAARLLRRGRDRIRLPGRASPRTARPATAADRSPPPRG
ncbi:MAG: polyprenol phosphomannose-dependent alpha 1,6 mannosyltransferase MptB [Mycobacteriales bacterium]